jgi:O-antigen ligase
LKKYVEKIFNAVARVSFGLTLVVLPFRHRIELLNRETYPVYQDYTNFLLFASDITLGLMLLFWIPARLLGERKISYRPISLTGLLVALTALSALSTASSIDPELSAYHSLRIIMLIGFYIYIINEIKDLDQIIGPLLIQLPIQGIVAITQVTRQGSVGLGWLGEHDLDPARAGISVVLDQGERILRAYGLADHPNILGGVLALGLLVLSGWIVARWEETPTIDPGKLLVSAGIFTIGFVALFMTYSRTAWLAWLGGSAIFLLLLWKTGSRKRINVLFGLWFAGALLTSPFILQNRSLLGSRLNLQNSLQSREVEERSFPERAALIQAGNRIFSQSPLLGVGLGAFPLALQQVEPEFPYPYQPPHIVLLEVAAETGILNALLFSIILIWPWFIGLTQRKSLLFSPAVLTAYALLFAITMIGLFDYYPWLLQPGRLWLWLSWGLWAVVYTQSLDGSNYV